MGEITASVAHELNQPLTAIVNTAAAARRFLDRGESDPSFFRGLVENMSSDSLRASEVIRGIRRMVRKEKSASTVLNLNALIADTLRLVSSDVVMRDSAIITDLDNDIPSVEAGIVTTRAVNGTAEVSVRVFGPGLPIERPEKVFDHFFSTKASGMGMGLTIVRSIIEAHAGTIGVENPVGSGARFFFRLPAAPEQKSKAA